MTVDQWVEEVNKTHNISTGLRVVRTKGQKVVSICM